jgi:hypothetical protein
MRAEGRLFETDWRHYNCGNLVMLPRQLSIGAFYDQYMNLLKQLHAPLLVGRKVLAHLRQYRDIKLASILLGVLLVRSWNTYRHHLPELRRDRQRAQRRAAEAEMVRQVARDDAAQPLEAAAAVPAT